MKAYRILTRQQYLKDNPFRLIRFSYFCIDGIGRDAGDEIVTLRSIFRQFICPDLTHIVRVMSISALGSHLYWLSILNDWGNGSSAFLYPILMGVRRLVMKLILWWHYLLPSDFSNHSCLSQSPFIAGQLWREASPPAWVGTHFIVSWVGINRWA